MSYPWKALKQVVEESDILFEVLDARMVELTRNEDVEEMIKEAKKPFGFVINKSDLTSKKQVNKEAEKLRKETKKDVFVVSGKERKGINGLRDKLHQLSGRSSFARLRVGFVGYPNTGKSSITNSLARRKKVEVTSKAGTTRGIQWVSIGDKLMINDSPGIIPLKKWDEVRYGLIGARDVNKIKELELVANHIIQLFLKDDDTQKSLEKFYDIKIHEEILNDPEEILELIGKRRGFMKSGGVVDENRTSKDIIKNWQAGTLRL